MMHRQAPVVSLVSIIATVFSIFCAPSSAIRAAGFGFRCRSSQRPVPVPFGADRAGRINTEAPTSSLGGPDRRVHSRTASKESSWWRRGARVVPSDGDGGGYDYEGGAGSSNAPVPTNEDGDENSPAGTPMSGGAVGDAPPPPEQPMYTFVEGTAFDNRVSEVEAMGGDPFFLVDDDASSAASKDESSTPSEEELPSLASFGGFGGGGVDGVIGSSGGGDEVLEVWSVTDGNGPREIAEEDILLDEWDGWEVEDAHFD